MNENKTLFSGLTYIKRKAEIGVSIDFYDEFLQRKQHQDKIYIYLVHADPELRNKTITGKKRKFRTRNYLEIKPMIQVLVISMAHIPMHYRCK